MKLIRMIAFATGLAIAGGAVTGCYVETRHPYYGYHHYHRYYYY